MSISDKGFFRSYQASIGTTYARGYDELYNPSSTLQNYVLARQDFIANLSSSEVTGGLTVINAHLTSENSYTSSASYIAKSVLQTLNSFFNNTYSFYTRDYFNATTAAKTIPWQNSFKEAWYQANSQELVQQIGFASWNGSNFVVFPANSSVTNTPNTIGVATTSGNNVTIDGFSGPISNFAMPGDIIVAASTNIFPLISNISLGTTVIGFANTNTLVLSGPIGSATSLFAFRPMKGSESLEFRFGTASVTGSASTNIFSTLVLSVTLNSGVTTSVTIGAANSTGRINVGVYNNATYKSTGISTMSITSGSESSLGVQKSLEIWVKSIY